jgi:hypothetical protein
MKSAAEVDGMGVLPAVGVVPKVGMAGIAGRLAVRAAPEVGPVAPYAILQWLAEVGSVQDSA